jgi:hypothetical protein
MASLDDVVTQLQSLALNIGQLVTVTQNVFPRTIGSFTLANATVTVVTQPAVKANSVVELMPTNATAALTQRTQGLFVSAYTAGTSFSLSTQSGSATGAETFQYIVVNPV